MLKSQAINEGEPFIFIAIALYISRGSGSKRHLFAFQRSLFGYKKYQLVTTCAEILWSLPKALPLPTTTNSNLSHRRGFGGEPRSLRPSINKAKHFVLSSTTTSGIHRSALRSLSASEASLKGMVPARKPRCFLQVILSMPHVPYATV